MLKNLTRTRHESARQGRMIRLLAAVLCGAALLGAELAEAREKELWRQTVSATGQTKKRAVTQLIARTEAVEKQMFERCEKSGGLVRWSDVTASGQRDRNLAEQTLVCVERPRGRVVWEAPANQTAN